MSKKTVHLWWLGLDKDKFLHKVDYFQLPAWVSGNPLDTNIKSAISRLSFSETDFEIDKPAKNSERRPMHRPEQKPVAVMKHILWKFATHG